LPCQSEECGVDEVGFLSKPADFGCRFDNYLAAFSGKSRKRLGRELDALTSRGVTFRYDDPADGDRAFGLNLDAFGDESYFADDRFLESFRLLAELLRPRGLLRVTAVVVAAHLAEAMSLPYPSKRAVRLCPNKFRCKRTWQAAGVPCPDAEIVSTEEEAIAFQGQVGRCVLKPLTGSGSELVFFRDTPANTRRALRRTLKGLQGKKDNRLYAGATGEVLTEQFVTGPEYSCDALLGDCDLRIIRLSRKIPTPDGPFGAVRGYVVPADLPDGASAADLEQVLGRAAPFQPWRRRGRPTWNSLTSAAGIGRKRASGFRQRGPPPGRSAGCWRRSLPARAGATACRQRRSSSSPAGLERRSNATFSRSRISPSASSRAGGSATTGCTS